MPRRSSWTYPKAGQYPKGERWLLERKRAKDVWEDVFVFNKEERAKLYIKHMVEQHDIDPCIFRISKLRDDA